MACSRCGGCAILEMVRAEETIAVARCVNCGAVFGDPLLDAHHVLEQLPPPWSLKVHVPIYVPRHRRREGVRC